MFSPVCWNGYNRYQALNKSNVNLSKNAVLFGTAKEFFTLSNGTKERKELVSIVFGRLEGLFNGGFRGICAFVDLVRKCRDDEFSIPPENVSILKSTNLMDQDGKIHDAVRNIVLCASEGDGLDMKLKSPLERS